MDLLDLFASITLDTSGYEKGLDKAEQTAESAASSIASSSDNIANSFETQNNMLAYLQEQYNYAQKAVNEIATAFNEAVSSTGAFSEETAALAADLGKAEKELKTAESNLEKYQASINTAASNTNNFVNANDNISESVNDVSKALSDEESAIRGSSDAAAQSRLTFSEYFNALVDGFAEIGSRISEIPSQLDEFATKGKNALTVNSNQLKILKTEYKEAKDRVKELKVELSASVNSTGAASEQTKELAKQLKEAENAAASTKKELKDFNDKTSKTSEMLKAVSVAAKAGATAVSAIGTAVASAGAAMIKATSDTAAYADNIDKASQKLGVSAEFYQEWDAVLKHSGTSMSSMTTTFRTLAKAAQDMSGDQQAAFEKLGISIESVASLSTEDLFEQVISGLQKMESSTERTNIATNLLGRGAMEMGALLNTSAEDTQKMIDTVHNLGGVMSDEAIKAGAAFRDSLQDLQTAINGVKNNLAAEFLPSMVEVMDGLAAVFSGDSSGIEKAKEGVKNFIDELSEQLPKVADFGGEVISALLEGISDNLTDITSVAVDIIGKLVMELISLAPTLVNSAVEIINQLFGFLQENAYVIADGAVHIITSLANGISDLLPDLIPVAVDIIMQISKGIADNAGEIIAAALQLITALSAGIIEALPQLTEAVVELPKSIAVSLINFDWASVAKKTMSGIVDAFDNAGKQFKVWLDNTFGGGKVYGGDIANVDSEGWIETTRENINFMFGEVDNAQENLEKAQNELVEVGYNGAKIAGEAMAAFYKEQAIAASKGGNEVSDTIKTSGTKIADTTKKTGEKQKSVLAQNMEGFERLYKQRKITEEEYQKRRLEYLEKHRDEESDEWTKYYDSVQTYYEKLSETEEKAAKKAAEEAKKNFQTILDTYDKQLQDVQKKIDSFAQNLTGAYKDFYTFTTKGDIYKEQLKSRQDTITAFEKEAERLEGIYGKESTIVINAQNKVKKATEEYEKFQRDHNAAEDSEIVDVKTTDKMTQAGKRLEEYYNQLIKFSERGIGESMISQLSNFSQEEGLATLKYWNSLSDDQIKNLQAHYDKVTEFSGKISEKIYESDTKKAVDGVINEISLAVESDERFKEIGEMMFAGIMEGLDGSAGNMSDIAGKISTNLNNAFNAYFESGTTSSSYTAASPSYTQTAATTTLPVAESAAVASETVSNPQTTTSGENSLSIEVNIEQFNNYTNDDIETLADKVLIAIQNKVNQRQVAFS